MSQLLSCAVGLWIMVSPAVLRLQAPESTIAWVVGPCAASVGLVAVFEVLRGARMANLVTGAALVLSPLAGSHTTAGIANAIGAGILLMILSLRSGSSRKSYGGGWWELVRD